jgi:1-aminocyclopropane-1-carboxylate deaminase/D-cysteine desulfhydrase-like pyridoxal-dependent ACC family enzyme
MLAEIEMGRLEQSDPIIFLHTGGLPALFAFPGQIP